jgi:MscS family membrane protein
MDYIYSFLERFHLLVGLGFILFIALVVHIIYAMSIRRICKSSETKVWIKILFKYTSKQMKSIIWIIAISFCLNWLSKDERIQLFISSSILIHVRNILIIILFTWGLLKLKSAYLLYIQESKTTPSSIPIELHQSISKLLTLIICTISLLVILSILNVPLQALLTFGGVGTLAFSWAAKDFIANFFGGLMIHINQPFTIGNTISITGSKQYRGTVKDLGWYQTEIVTDSGNLAYVPNGMMTNAILENENKGTYRVLTLSLNLGTLDEEKVFLLIQKLNERFEKIRELSIKKPPTIQLTSFDSSSITVDVKLFIDLKLYPEYLIQKTRDELKLKILLPCLKLIKEENNINI